MVALYTNSSKDGGLEFTHSLSQHLNNLGVENILLSENNLNSIPNNVSLIIVMGGDGTVLNVVNSLEHSIPILGINLGNLGFLTAADQEDVALIGQLIKTNSYTFEYRDMLEVTVNGKGFSALNEVVVTRKNSFQLITVCAYVGEVYIDTYRGDGVILSSPTGSTAYSLSCGGPILSPELDAFLLVGINPHSLHNRPIVLSNKQPVKLVVNPSESGMSVICDGRTVFSADKPYELIVTKSKKQACFVLVKTDSFFDRLHHKLTTGGG